MIAAAVAAVDRIAKDQSIRREETSACGFAKRRSVAGQSPTATSDSQGSKLSRRCKPVLRACDILYGVDFSPTAHHECRRNLLSLVDHELKEVGEVG